MGKIYFLSVGSDLMKVVCRVLKVSFIVKFTKKGIGVYVPLLVGIMNAVNQCSFGVTNRRPGRPIVMQKKVYSL